MTTINIRTDEKLKKKAQKTLKEMGLDMSGAIKLFLQQVVITKTIPFPIKTANGFTYEEGAKLLAEKKKLVADIKSGKAKLYSSAEELTSDLLK
ncbi:type II toxin-antitoxin system RelB/DinJ family antitoxin [Candidatus Peregrinibacteria bacterium]|jgi:addiction module RelB/DinJ family antitoxin|nr:type II toxin-antitoxin system RelB/DinJ family antitoxin [Candidatus Peregrinibacteria bacterium]MBT4631847.1 type II toxin-antitoxin system RelB/DinJ family antitoxin [Candidatus Peregrinibacteria bacterium]MBT5516520.1 type II toxin-antitoxin system RelB/DinJ family antitoxin [Candidatus Peregrinibacteria bacterium]MBT5823623.1 type II toxin-antitoxin system RelB/DinJ family antitoxin [Candidatus Peregrinibacteria bacterium]